MQKKLYISYLATIILALGIAGILFWNETSDYLYNQSEERYLAQAKMVADLFTVTGFETSQDYDAFAGKYGDKYGCRITIIDKDGNVVADSDTNDKLENHKSREEVQRALKGESVSVTRYSNTMKQEYSYSAVPVNTADFSGVIRISLPFSTIQGLTDKLGGSLVITVFLCLVLAMAAAAIFTGLLTRPINEVAKAAERISDGDYNIKIYTRDKSVVGKLARSFNIMAVNFKNTITTLTHRNAELEAMLSSMEAGVVAIDDSSEVLFFNKSFEKTEHTRKAIAVGQSLYSVFRNAAVFDVVDEVKETKKSVMKEGSISGDSMRYIRVTGTPLGLEGEKSFGVLLIIEDITQLKKLENMRRDFVSNVTHELKTPLTSIRGFIDTLKNGAIKEEAVANRFLDIIDIEAERLSTLIQDILLLQEIESKRDYERLPLDINESVNAVIELLQPKITGDIEIVFKPQPYLKPFYCNPDRMKQLFINLLDNAVKYTEKGTITITLKEEEDNLVLGIKDTGIGIEKEYLPRIFERFYRVDKGRSRKQGGTGLGLSIVKHIVELYNGNIQVNSTLGVGTEFIITLPYNMGNKK
ncbi:ATP-binding protein [Anaerocolumna xylanovorans]|uniref:histidine kinase n=1 Tax=Anaerocolumna xylanovorans DSM 12503 TaxID=1121345 RepID=A0A1M7YHI9_9FIRM|nr:ATP-binding protein [Anaerocolumna xylanovorans]SHO52092.1 two-component system, OmpR family, phosphate regulon sensor histidine kinase PhoR [Anaerocolumna xylanovorans DSM 12503]